MKKERRVTEAAKCAKAIRAELKENFPAIKFNVTSKTYSGGNSVNIKWVDAVSSEEVEKIVSKYEQGTFNPMEDIYEYNNSIDGLPQVKFLFCSRSISDESIQKALDGLNENRKEKLTLEDNFYGESSCNYDDKTYRIIRRILEKKDLTNFKKLVSTDCKAGIIEDFYKVA